MNQSIQLWKNQYKRKQSTQNKPIFKNKMRKVYKKYGHLMKGTGLSKNIKINQKQFKIIYKKNQKV